MATPVRTISRTEAQPGQIVRNRLITVVLALAVIALTGCVPDAAPTPTSPSPSTSSSGSLLLPAFPDDFSAAAAESETVRIGDRIVALLNPTVVVNDDFFSQEVAATDGSGSYWGVLHTLTLDPSVEPIDQARTTVARMTEAGWIARDTTEENGTYLAALVSDADAATSWFAVVGADSSVAGQSVVSLQLASPTLP